MKKIAGNIIILHVYQKPQSYEIQFLRYRVRQSFWAIFCPFTPPPLTTQKIKLLKNEKQSWRYYHFTHAYHKWKSYDVWFLRYGVWQTEFFLILEHFLHFYPSSPHPPSPPLTAQRIKILKKWKKTLEISSFYTSVP